MHDVVFQWILYHLRGEVRLIYYGSAFVVGGGLGGSGFNYGLGFQGSGLMVSIHQATGFVCVCV